MVAQLKTLGSTPSFEVNGAWDIARLCTIARVRSEKSRPNLEMLSVFLGRGVIPYGEGGGQVHKPSLDLSGYQAVYPGDLVLNNQQAWRGSVGVSRHLGIISPAYLVFSLSDSLDPRFADYLFQCGVMVAQFVTCSKGVGDIQRDVHTPWLKNIRVPIPTREEQAAIVRFLDHADRRIRRYIGAKQKLIKLLEEQKQANIHRAVTRGLNSNVRLKPSGVEWLGDVPEHWQLLPLKRACSLLRDGTHLPPPRKTEGFPLLSVRNIVSNSFVRRPDDSRISESHFNDLCRSFTPQRDDVLLAIVGATLGKVAIVPEMEPFQIQRSLAVLRPLARLLDFRFLAAFLRGPGFQRALWTTVAFSAQPGIYLNTLCNFCVALPPISEQQTIIVELDGSTGQLARAISSAHREIYLLREYLTRLIADVVTGKLDVRDAAARLPDEAEQPESLDEAEPLAGGDEQTENAWLDATTAEAEA